MPREMDIAPVPQGAVGEALRFLAGGRRRDVATAVRAEAFERMVGRCGGRRRFWWARRGGRCVAASLAVAGFGRVGMLSHSPLDAPGVERAGVLAVVERAGRQALADGLAFVQSLVAPTRQADMAVLVSAGFRRLAELVYMRLDLAEPLAGEDRGRYAWRSFRGYTEEELSSIITATYEHSLDCPALRGLRAVSDVIEGHKASGIFSPRSWWIVSVGSRPAGCVLLNDSTASPGAMDLVYMGVASEFRGRGIGRAMVRRAARWARRRRRRFLTVAADTRNIYAKRIYDELGFRETLRRLAYILLREAPPTEGT